MSETQTRPGLTPERIGFFADAVFAIAMTLLVIEIPRPEDDVEFSVGGGVSKAEAAGRLVRFLYEQTGSFVAYLLAFWMLWIVWRQHHRLLDRITGMSPAMVGWHFPLLLVIGFMPYATTVLGHHTDNPAAAFLYAGTVGALMICRSGLQSQALRDGMLRPGEDRAEFGRTACQSWIVTAYWLATLLLCWWTPWVIIAWSLSPAVGPLVHRLRPAR